MATRPTRPSRTAGSAQSVNPAAPAGRPPAGPRPAEPAAPHSPRPAEPAASAAPAGPRPAEPAAPAGARPAEPANRPIGLRLAAAALVVEAVGICVAAAFAAVWTVDGRSYQFASGIALTLIVLGTAGLIVALAAGVARARPWSRTPAVMTQLFVIIAGVTLLDGHRPEWGVPALLLAAACLAGLLTPASLRALNRPPVNKQPRQ